MSFILPSRTTPVWPRTLRAAGPRWMLAALALSLFAAYVAAALTPSSYALGLELLGMEPSGTWLGRPRPIRSDEWMVYTPYVQIAVMNHMGQVDALSPYGENLRSFQSLPLLDWSMPFKPDQWGFLVLPPAHAYSFHFGLLALAFIAGWILLVHRLGIPLRIGALTALALFFSQFIQAWWTTNAGAFAYAPWVGLAWLCCRQRGWRIACTAYAMAVWIFSCAYPPFLYSAAAAIAFLLLALRRDAFTMRTILDAAFAAVLSSALFFLYFRDLIPLMLDTVYPGRRQSASGESDAVQLLAYFNPTLLISGYEPLRRYASSNACEIAVLSTLMPIQALVLSRHRQFFAWARAHPWSLHWIMAGLALFVCWMYLSVNPTLAGLSGLSIVPGQRALLGFGIMINISAAAYMHIATIAVTARRLVLLLLAVLCGVVTKYFLANMDLSAFSWMDAVPFLAIPVLAAASAAIRDRNQLASVPVAVAAIANMLTFGLFNPVQSAHPIFSIDREAVAAKLESQGAAKRPDGVLVAPGHYGALINGVGIPSINHVLYYPQTAFFRQYFQEEDDARFNAVFNRFAHISTGSVFRPTLVSNDHIELPFDVMAGLPGQAAHARMAPPEPAVAVPLRSRPDGQHLHKPFGHVDRVIVEDDGSFAIEGWSRTELDANAMIAVWADGQVASLRGWRVRRPDVAAAVDPALENSGYVIQGRLARVSRLVEMCLVVYEGGSVASISAFADSSLMCSKITAEESDVPGR